MTLAIWVILGVLAVPVVLLLATTGCTNDYEDFNVEPSEPPEPPPTYEQTVLATAGLLGYWRLGENNAVLTTQEPKAVNSFWPGNLDGVYGNPGGITLEQPGALANDPDTAALFAGGFVDVPMMELTGGEVTVELWAKPTPAPDWTDLVGCYESLASPGDTIVKGYRLRVRTVSDPDQIEIEANLGGMPAPLIKQVPVDAEWHHVVLTYLKAADPDPGTAELYIDGDSQGMSGDFDVGTTQSLRFGGAYPYPGLLDEVALYLNHLDKSDIAKHYEAASASNTFGP